VAADYKFLLIHRESSWPTAKISKHSNSLKFYFKITNISKTKTSAFTSVLTWDDLRLVYK
jgi:hypothetical protein